MFEYTSNGVPLPQSIVATGLSFNKSVQFGLPMHRSIDVGPKHTETTQPRASGAGFSHALPMPSAAPAMSSSMQPSDGQAGARADMANSSIALQRSQIRQDDVDYSFSALCCTL